MEDHFACQLKSGNIGMTKICLSWTSFWLTKRYLLNIQVLYIHLLSLINTIHAINLSYLTPYMSVSLYYEKLSVDTSFFDIKHACT
jgi:hypothetical protein